MARDGQQNGGASAPRVYKAGDVHKRRSGRRSREEQGQRLPVASRGGQPVPADGIDDAAADDLAAEVGAGIAGEAGVVEHRAVKAGRRATVGATGAIELPDDVSAGDGLPPDDALGVEDEGEDEVRVEVETEAEGAEAGASDYDDAEELPEGDFDESDEGFADGDELKRRRAKRPRGKTIAKVIVAIIVLAAIGCASFLAWNRWGRFDDHTDMQGEWYVEGTATPVVIDEGYIHLDQNIAYSYTINDRDKTIAYTFADWEGKGRYRFSDDRTQLVITDGEFSGAGNTVDDLTRPFAEVAQPSQEGIIAFNRQADPKALEAKQAQERAAAAKARQEALEGGEELGDEEGADADAVADAEADAEANAVGATDSVAGTDELAEGEADQGVS